MDPIKQSENSRLEVGQGEFFELLEWLFKSGVAIGIDQWLRKTARFLPMRSHGCTADGMIHCMRENPIEMEVSNSSWVSLCFLAAINVSSHRLSCAQMPARMEIHCF